jgi:hypothetical protein
LQGITASWRGALRHVAGVRLERRTGTPKRDCAFFLSFTQTLSAASHRAFVLSIEPKMTAPSYFCGRISAAARRLLGRRNCSTNFIPPEESPLLSSRRAPTQNSLKGMFFQDRFQIFFGLTAVSLIFLDDFPPGLERRLIRHMNGIKKETNQKIENLDRKIENVEGSLNAKIANVGLNLNTKMSQLELNLNTNMSNLNTKMSRLPFVRVLEHFK